MARHRPALALGLLLVCCQEKASAPAPPRSIATASSAAAALSSAPAAAVPVSAPAPLAPAPSGLRTIGGEQLIARIKRSGKKATVVNAWASWCGPCRREIPMLQAIAENYRHEGVEFLLVSVDEPEERPQAEAFLRDNDVILEGYLAARPLEPFKRALNPRWPGMLPATFLFDASGVLRYFWGGPAYENEIVPIIEGLLAGKAIDGEATFGLAPGQVVQ